MTETVYSFFEEGGTPVVGLTPSIVGVDWSNNENLFSGTMSELWAGRYKYKIVNYNKGATYLITVDGGDTLTNRYQSVINELDAYPNKTDRRSISTRTINNEEIAKAVREYKGKIKEGTIASLLSKDIDYTVIWLQFEDMKKELAKIDLTKINFQEYKWFSLDDIELVVSKYNSKEDINKLVSLMKWIQEMNTILNKECDDIKGLFDTIKVDIFSKIDWVEDKIDSLWLDDIIKDINSILEKVETFESVVENLESVPEIVWHYKSILDWINSNRWLEDKLITIRLWVNDILSRLK